MVDDFSISYSRPSGVRGCSLLRSKGSIQHRSSRVRARKVAKPSGFSMSVYKYTMPSWAFIDGNAGCNPDIESLKYSQSSF